VAKGVAYPCFCSDEDLQKMRNEAEKLNLPPVYRGKWANASAEDVQAAKDAGTPYCYRFRVPKDKNVRCPSACNAMSVLRQAPNRV
jgi:glutamyl-tRNA synthetase